MTIKVKSTKAWHKLPCAHAQHFDLEQDGSPGECASIHGYDRSVKITFAGEVDEQGWIVPFGELKQVKEFIEYYFDHTCVLPANDPRLNYILETYNKTPIAPLFKLRVLPYGVSMEMSSLFIWEHVNAFVRHITDDRCYVERVESIEHDSNSAFIEVSEEVAKRVVVDPTVSLLPKKPMWTYKQPQTVLSGYNK